MARKPADQTVNATDIITAAARVFHQRGYHGATMADIAAEVNLTAGSLYHHFASKEDLLSAVLHAGLTAITADVQAIVKRPDTSTNHLRQVIAVHVQSVVDYLPVAAAVIFESRDILANPTVRESFVAQRDALEALYRGVIANGIAAGEFQPVDVGLFVKTLFGALNWVSVWYRPEGRLDAPAIAREIAATFLMALGVPRVEPPQ